MYLINLDLKKNVKYVIYNGKPKLKKKKFSVPSHKGSTFNNGETNRSGCKTKNAISIIRQKIDSNLHQRIYREKSCMVFGDIDYCPNDKLNDIFEIISKE